VKRIAFAVTLAACGHAAPMTPSTRLGAEIEAAETAEKARQHDEARRHYEAAVAAATDPASIAFARREFAETLITWGEIAEAINQLEAVVAAEPGDAAAWNDLGILRHNQGDDRRALEALEHARTASPKDIRPRIALAALRWQTGDRAGAAAEYKELLELELPDRVRDKVKWALAELAKPQR
jgi:Flp pilus assembly protein TadD